jgi:sensor histidine kinase YesM
MMRSSIGKRQMQKHFYFNELDTISEKVEVMDGKCRKKAKKEDQQT